MEKLYKIDGDIDDKELNVFNNNESRIYFKEILQSYYSQNYRATIVLLYSSK